MTSAKKPIFIAEVKTKSPFGYESTSSFHSILKLAVKHGDWISVHDNALWGGDYETISYVRRYTDKPILAKGIHSTERSITMALNAGADYVLCVEPFDNCAINVFREKVLFEHLQLPDILNPNLKYVANARNILTGHLNLKKQHQDIKVLLETGVWTCQASFIRRPTDIISGVDAFIVGENIEEFCHYHERA